MGFFINKFKVVLKALLFSNPIEFNFPNLPRLLQVRNVPKIIKINKSNFLKTASDVSFLKWWPPFSLSPLLFSFTWLNDRKKTSLSRKFLVTFAPSFWPLICPYSSSNLSKLSGGETRLTQDLALEIVFCKLLITAQKIRSSLKSRKVAKLSNIFRKNINETEFLPPHNLLLFATAQNSQ